MWAAHVSDDPPLLVAEVDDGVVGFVSYGPSRDKDAGDRVAEVYAIYVSPEHWGRGVGKALHDEAVKQLRSRGFDEATLWVLDTNERTLRWYERQGWSPDGSEKMDEIGGARVREVRYRLSA